MKLRKYIAIMSVLVIGAFAFFPSGKALKDVDPKMLPISYAGAQYIINMDSIEAQLAFADYAFIAHIVSYDDVYFASKQEIGRNGIFKVMTGIPRTRYTIEIEENIKGNLQTGTALPMTKKGGVSYDQTYVELYENDILPEVGETYLILANGQDDGSLLCAGPNTSILLEKDGSRSVESIDICEEYKAVVATVEDYPRERSASIYEVPIE